MKQTTLKILLAAAFITAFAACSDDEKPKSKAENPLSDYLKEAGFTEVSEFIDDGDYEFGISFIPQTAGTITSIVVKLPDDQEDLRVSIWDAETETLLRTEIIASAKAGKKVSKSIDPLEVISGHEYMITFNADDYYYHENAEGAEVTYPITVGNISVTGYGYASGADQVFPTGFYTDYYAGDLSFGFTPADN